METRQIKEHNNKKQKYMIGADEIISQFLRIFSFLNSIQNTDKCRQLEGTQGLWHPFDRLPQLALNEKDGAVQKSDNMR